MTTVRQPPAIVHEQLSTDTDRERLVRFEPCAGEGRVAIYQSVGALAERFRGSRFAHTTGAPLDLCLRAYLADLGGTVDAAGFALLLQHIEKADR